VRIFPIVGGDILLADIIVRRVLERIEIGWFVTGEAGERARLTPTPLFRMGAPTGTSLTAGLLCRAMTISSPASARATRSERFDFASCMLIVAMARVWLGT
jgi:hypothetical protein